jgi:hypothetical protein
MDRRQLKHITGSTHLKRELRTTMGLLRRCWPSSSTPYLLVVGAARPWVAALEPVEAEVALAILHLHAALAVAVLELVHAVPHRRKRGRRPGDGPVAAFPRRLRVIVLALALIVTTAPYIYIYTSNLILFTLLLYYSTYIDTSMLTWVKLRGSYTTVGDDVVLSVRVALGRGLAAVPVRASFACAFHGHALPAIVRARLVPVQALARRSHTGFCYFENSHIYRP